MSATTTRPWTVVLLPEALRDIGREAARPAGIRETGGRLFGGRDNTGHIVIRGACATSPDAARDPGYVTRSIAHGYRHARLRSMRIAGGWHTHVDPVTDLSDADRRTCAANLEVLSDDYDDDNFAFVEVIATRNHLRGWLEPDLTGYVFTEHNGRVTSERAEVRR